MPYACRHCGRSNFKSQKGLTQHLNSHSVCSLKEKQITLKIAHLSTSKQKQLSSATDTPDHAQMPTKLRRMDKNDCPTSKDAGLAHAGASKARFTRDSGQKLGLESDDDNGFLDMESDESEDEREVNEEKVHLPVDTETLQNFKDYVLNARQHFLPFTKEEAEAIKLLDTLRKKRATLDTYDDVMLWHFRSNSVLKDDEGLGHAKAFISRKRMLRKLAK